MQQNRNEVEFIGSGFASYKQRWANFGAIPRSTVQTSPGLTPRIFVLHPVKHQPPLEGGLIAQRHVCFLVGDFEQSLANRPTLGFAQFRQLFDDFRCAHGRNYNPGR